jgi:erythromycin esterase-like protein
MLDDGELNLGQLVRERHAAEGVVLVGFSSYRGSVIAGTEWGAPYQVMRVPEGRSGTYEQLLHELGEAASLLLFEEEAPGSPLIARRGHRAIGVVYDPELEQFGNYVATVLPKRYDALLFIDESRAVKPLRAAPHEEWDPAETFPSGL